LSKEAVVAAFMKMYEYGDKKREEIGKKGRTHVLKNYNFENFAKKWENILTDLHNKKGSWENRKDYKKWELLEV
jgi:glycosyltransferase involved in cell wall biosynthesis